MNYFLIFLLAFFSLNLQSQTSKGTIYVKKNEGPYILKPCICGKTDTVFLTKKELFYNAAPIELCKGKEITKAKVSSFRVYMPGYLTGGINGNRFLFADKADSLLILKPLMTAPAFNTIYISDVQYNYKGITTLKSRLVIVLKD